MAKATKMTFPTEDEDDLDVDALRMAALQTLKKPTAPAVQMQNSLPNLHSNMGGPRVGPLSGLHPNQNQHRGRGRGVLRGRGRGRGNFPGSYHNNNAQNFFPSRPSGNSNLITIVPTVPDESGPSKDIQLQGSHLEASHSGSVVADSTLNEEEKVPAKFRRLDDDSDSEESDDEPGLKCGSDRESSGEEEDEKGGDDKSGNSDAESDKDTDLVTLEHEDEGDNSLERLMQELEDEISEAPRTQEKPKFEKVSKLKKVKKDKPKKAPLETGAFISDNGSSGISAHSNKFDGVASQCSDQKSSDLRHQIPQEVPVSRTQSKSPPSYEPVTRERSPQKCRSPRAASPACSKMLQKSLPAPLRTLSPQTRSPRRSRSPLRSRSPVKSRSPLRTRSPRRSRSRSPRRSPPRGHHQVSTRSPNFVSRKGSVSPRRSPHYLPLRASSPAPAPARLPPLRSRSRSPRPLRSRSRSRPRSPCRGSYARRSRSRSPLASLRPNRSASPGRRSPLFRRSRSRSRSPGGRLYAPRRSRSRSPPPRAPPGSRRSISPRSRRSPLYAKKLSPKRRSISPRRRSISPRRRSVSPRRRSISPRRRSVSPRRRQLSPGWSRASPPRNRSPVGTFSQRHLSPRRRSPYSDAHAVRRSPSPAARKYSPAAHRVGSPARNYRSPSPVPRSNVRRRSPPPTNGPLRRSPLHRAASPSYRLSPAKQSRIAGSPSRNREKQRPVSPPVSRNNQRLPSPRRQRSPVPYSRSYHLAKASSPVRRVSPTSHNLKRSTSPLKECAAPSSGRELSPNDSISLSPSPERQSTFKPLDDRNRGRKSHPLPDNHSDSKRSRSDLRSVLPRRKDIVKESVLNVATRSEEPSKKERKERKRAKREKERQKREAQQHDSGNVLEARRRKFESSAPVEVCGKKIRLRNMATDAPEEEEQVAEIKDVELNVETEKERELKEVNEVDESILDRELMGGVDLLWSDEEEEEEEEEEDEDDTIEPSPAVNNVQFKRTFNMPSTSNSSGKENIPKDSIDSKKDDGQPTSTTESPRGNQNRDEGSDQEDCGAASDISGDELKSEDEPQETWPKTNRELKEYIISQAKGSGPLVRFPKVSAKELQSKTKSNDSDDLRDELSRRRAERLTKVNSYPETLPGRLLQSALQGVGVKSRREKSHRRRERSPLEETLDQRESDGRRVLVVRRAAEQKEPAINITISKVESSKESNSKKMVGKLPIHLRLGTGKKGDDSPKKVKLKRNTSVGRKKQV